MRFTKKEKNHFCTVEKTVFLGISATKSLTNRSDTSINRGRIKNEALFRRKS